MSAKIWIPCPSMLIEHVMSFFDSEDDLIDTIVHITNERTSKTVGYELMYPTVPDAVRHLFNEPHFLYRNVDIAVFLRRLGYTDEDMDAYGMGEIYISLLTEVIDNIYTHKK